MTTTIVVLVVLGVIPQVAAAQEVVATIPLESVVFQVVTIKINYHTNTLYLSNANR
jgi:hypothetical protein